MAEKRRPELGAMQELVESTTLAALPGSAQQRLPWSYTVTLSTMGALRRRRMAGYRFNLYRLEAR
ncbi:hypothetical protein GCM10010252_65680 [Streptomyces aureoverticillatus]|nr:hypothetical protein GCM10010252_65680 [Streptomyces aureoverticillatus]